MADELGQDLALIKSGSYSQQANVLDHYLWDKNMIPATAPSGGIAFFTKPIGGTIGAVNKDVFETNLSDASKIPTGQAFLLKKLRFDIADNIEAADLDFDAVYTAYKTIMQNAYVQINIIGREFEWQAPSQIFFPPTWFRGRTTMIDATDRPVSSGEFQHFGWVTVGTKIVLSQQVNFNVTIRFGSSVTAQQTNINDALTVLELQKAQLMLTMRGTLVRSV